MCIGVGGGVRLGVHGLVRFGGIGVIQQIFSVFRKGHMATAMRRKYGSACIMATQPPMRAGPYLLPRRRIGKTT
jgi:hypothetical protein